MSEVANRRLSEHFWLSEFVCKHCGGLGLLGERAIYNLEKLTYLLERYRNEFNTPFIITSGIRCLAHNSAIGGAPNSFHLYGMAADFYVNDDQILLSLARVLYDEWPGGVGWYPQEGFIHVDIGYRRRWKRLNGQYLSWYGEIYS